MVLDRLEYLPVSRDLFLGPLLRSLTIEERVLQLALLQQAVDVVEHHEGDVLAVVGLVLVARGGVLDLGLPRFLLGVGIPFGIGSWCGTPTTGRAWFGRRC